VHDVAGAPSRKIGGLLLSQFPRKENQMFSKYLRTRERDGMVAVFHELHPDPVYITADDWSAYCSGEILNNLLDSQLRERKLVISEMSDDDRAFATAESLVLGKLQHTTILYLMTVMPIADIVRFRI
jgi:hypothetical protein